MTDLEQFLKILEDQGFDASLTDGVVAGSKETPGYAVEITIDGGGGCLVKKTTMGKQSSKLIVVAQQKIAKISFGSQTSQIRLKIASSDNLVEVMKSVDSPRF